MQDKALLTKLTKMILQTGCPSNHLISWWKLGKIQKFSAKIPKAFQQHGKAEKTII